MVIVVLSGGIGAQLFQYAAGYQLAKINVNILDACWFNKKTNLLQNPLLLISF